MILKELERAKKKYSDLILASKGKEDKNIELYKKQLGMIVMLLRMRDEKWEMSDKSRQYLNDALTMDIKDVVEKYETTENAVRKMLSKRAKQFEEKIGKSTLNLIEQGKIDEAMLQFKQSWGILKKEQIFSDYFLDKLDTNNLNDVDMVNLLDCKEELKLMRLHCKDMINSQLEGVDMEKIRGILKLLEYDNPVYVTEKSLLNSFFMGQMSYSELLKSLQDLNT